jgi:hypothetical protein
MTIIEKAKAIRSEALAAWIASPDFAAFKASDDFVVALGGESVMPAGLQDSPKVNGLDSPRMREIGAAAARRLEIHIASKQQRITQADAAEAALRDKGEPLPVGRFMEAAEAKGASFAGKNPLANFRSAVSKDERFYSFARNNMYFWWFKGEPLPLGWNETADPDLLAESAASSVLSSQEGGDAHAATT